MTDDTELRGEDFLNPPKQSETMDGDHKSANEAEKAIAAQIPEGRYAVKGRDRDSWKFYVVRKGKEGTKWEGYTFLEIQASDDLYPVRFRSNRIEVYNAILEMGVAVSMMKYGIEIGSCAICGRTLTDEESRKLGIGPVCLDRFGAYI